MILNMITLNCIKKFTITTKKKKIYFYNDKEKDYDIIMDEVEYDLMSAGVKI